MVDDKKIHAELSNDAGEKTRLEEEGKKAKSKEEEKKYEGLPEDVEIIEERTYVIPIWKVLRRGRGMHRARKASKFLREFIVRHMKNPNVKISPEVNEVIWSRGIRNPPKKITVKVVRTSEEEIWILKG